jgi:hypothetical protein
VVHLLGGQQETIEHLLADFRRLNQANRGVSASKLRNQCARQR